MTTSEARENGNAREFDAAVHELTVTLLEGGRQRLDLMLLELSEERERGQRLVIAGVGAVVLGALAFICLNVLLFAVFWAEYRIQIAVTLTAVYALSAIGLALFVRKKARSPHRALDLTREQLQKDHALLTNSTVHSH